MCIPQIPAVASICICLHDDATGLDYLQPDESLNKKAAQHKSKKNRVTPSHRDNPGILVSRVVGCQ